MAVDKDIKRIRLLKLWEILSTETDKDNPLSTDEIISKLEGLGIECHRITLYEDIKLLNKYGYDIYKKRNEEPQYQDTMASEIRRIVEYINCSNIF